MTDEEFVMLMREKTVNVCWSVAYEKWWAWPNGKSMASSGETGDDPVEAMRKLAARMGWIEGACK